MGLCIECDTVHVYVVNGLYRGPACHVSDAATFPGIYRDTEGNLPLHPSTKSAVKLKLLYNFKILFVSSSVLKVVLFMFPFQTSL